MTLIEIIINSLIASNIIFVLILLNMSLLKNLFEKPIDVKYYYINNFFYTIILNYLYIIFFIIFLYCLRIYKCSELLDLKKLYRTFFDIIGIFSLFPIYIQIYFYLFIILLLLFLCLNTINFHKYFRHQVYILYLNARYHPEYIYANTIFDMNIMTQPDDLDLISHLFYTLSFKITYNYFKPSNISWPYYYTTLPWFHFHKLICKIIFSF